MNRLLITTLAAGSLFATAAIAAEPGQGDFDACNRAAQAAVASPSATPQTGGTTGPSTTTPAGTPDSTAGVQPGGAAGKTGPMITGSGRTPDSAGGVSQGTGAVAAGSAAGAPADGSLRGMSETSGGDPAFKAAYQDCMKQRGF